MHIPNIRKQFLKEVTMDPIKILFFDIDGTLVDPATKKISPKTREAIHRLHEKGFLLCIATGRVPASLPDFGDLHFDAFCTFNGSVCYNQTETIYHNPIPPESVKKVIENVTALGRPVSIALRDRLVANGVEKDLADYYGLAGLTLTASEDFEQACQENVYQIMMGCREQDHPAIIQGAKGVKIAVSWDRAVDVISDGGGKGDGIRKILEYYHLDPSQAVAFGDSYNDIEMLQAVGNSVAMGNAAQALKDIAAEVCGPVSEDGIYHYCLDRGWI